IINSRRSLEEAQAQYELTLSGTRPSVSLEITPYQRDQRRVTVPGGQPPSASERVRTQSVGAGVSVQLPLPTSGSLSAGLSNQMRFISGTEDRVEQVPEATVSLRQPLFVNGRFISDEVYRARLRNANIGVERQMLNNTLVVNGNIQRALNLLVRVGSLRRSRDVLDETIRVLRRQLESAELDRQQGLISDNSLLSLQVTLNNRREALFDTELALVQAEQDLARILGVPSLEGAELAENLFTGDALVQDDTLDETTGSQNAELSLQRLVVEQTVRSGLLNELEDRPNASVSVRVAPTYPDSRGDPDAVGASVGDFFESGADVEATVALGLTIPLFTARERSYRERIDTLTRLRAETDLADTERAVANEMETLFTNRRFLQRRVEILETDVEYERQRVENERSLLTSGATTELRVDEVELDLLSRRNELWQVEAELYLNGVEILAVAGEELSAILVGE
ncbi:MAG TPA: TolC family protein, partial [Alkalispirochaeta sp.]|nr:TolC family protein [Alkalispirochaeta sp.]